MNKHHSEIRQTIDDIYLTVERRYNFKINEVNVGEMMKENIQFILAEAEKNNSKAQFLLGRAFDFGYGVEKSRTKAAKNYEIAKKLGEIHSCYNLYDLEQDVEKKNELLNEGVEKE